MARQRRGNGEGGVTKRKDGSWMTRYTVWTPSGRKRKVIYAKSYAEARKKLAEALADRDGASATTPEASPWASTWSAGLRIRCAGT